MARIIELLEDLKISYAVVAANDYMYAINAEKEGLKDDIDIVINDTNRFLLNILKKDKTYKFLGEHSFFSIEDNKRVDLYFKTINVGYYHFLKIDVSSFIKKNVSLEEYIIYQIIDPLLKQKKYSIRHRMRLDKYFKYGYNDFFKLKLSNILGPTLSNLVISKILKNDFTLSDFFIKRCKFRLMFINNNFFRMLKSRILKW